MIVLKDAEEIKKIKAASQLAKQTLDFIADYITVSISTEKINNLCHQFTIKNGAIPAPLNYGQPPFPKSICTSINHVVCHGIPSSFEKLKEGDIINVDVTPILDGYHGDSSRTFIVGKISQEIEDLVSRTKKALYLGISAIKPGGYISDIGLAIDEYIKKFNYGIVKDLGGHGIGRKFHEEPFVFHHKQKKKIHKIKSGMVFTVEPMINLGTASIEIDKDDGWTVYTKDGKASAQFEHTVAVLSDGVEILTE